MVGLASNLISAALFMLLPPCRRVSASGPRLQRPRQLLSLPVSFVPSCYPLSAFKPLVTGCLRDLTLGDVRILTKTISQAASPVSQECKIGCLTAISNPTALPVYTRINMSLQNAKCSACWVASTVHPTLQES